MMIMMTMESLPSTPRIKKVARYHKKVLVAERENEKSHKSIHDMMDMEYRLTKKRNGAASSDALGDSSLFGDEKIVYPPKKKKGEDDDDGERIAQSNY
jgi:hypothetical protein